MNNEGKRMPMDLFFGNYFKVISENHSELLKTAGFDAVNFQKELGPFARKDN